MIGVPWKVPKLDVVREELLRAGALGEVLDRAGRAREVQILRVADHRDDQPLAFVERDRDAEVDPRPRDDALPAQLPVDPRVVEKRVDGRPRDECEVREVDVLSCKLGLELLA